MFIEIHLRIERYMGKDTAIAVDGTCTSRFKSFLPHEKIYTNEAVLYRSQIDPLVIQLFRSIEFLLQGQDPRLQLIQILIQFQLATLLKIHTLNVIIDETIRELQHMISQ